MSHERSVKINNSTYDYRFPKPIPAGTAIPAWAFIDVVTTDTFNVTAAEDVSLQNKTEIGPTTADVTSSTGSTTTPTSTASTAPATPTSSGGQGAGTFGNAAETATKSNVGPIVGGVVGGLFGVALVLAAAFWYRRRRAVQRGRALQPRFMRQVPAEMSQSQSLRVSEPLITRDKVYVS